jgi:trans-AT polyketide synthase, acyltransferase and oxidoreductase domains
LVYKEIIMSTSRTTTKDMDRSFIFSAQPQSSGRAGSSCAGWWAPGDSPPSQREEAFIEALHGVKSAFHLVKDGDNPAVATGGSALLTEAEEKPSDAFPLLASVAPCGPENLGDREFCSDHGLHYPYAGGSMAQGISSVDMVETLAREGMLAFYGAAGNSLEIIGEAIEKLRRSIDGRPHGFNLINSPNEPSIEDAVANLYIERGVKLIEASAYMDISLPLVRYRLEGIHCLPSGEIVTPHRIMAKVSRVEVASKFFSPPPGAMVAELLQKGLINEEQARMAEKIPMAQDLTAEADSGGHTDNRPALALLPTMISLKERLQDHHRYSQKLRVGAAGGIATPAAAAASFSMGAAYVVTGTVNQACVESGTSDEVRRLLLQTEQADVTMAPAADMFEMGVKVQVLKRGTMFAMRAAKLYNLYQACEGLKDIPESERTYIEKNLLHASFDHVWNQTIDYFNERDPGQIALAMKYPKHKMALIFRYYLSQSSRWAASGDISRKIDYQIWCGPSMGAFNEWAKGSFLDDLSRRRVVTVALNILFGASVIMRLNSLRFQGIMIRTSLNPGPFEESYIKNYLK